MDRAQAARVLGVDLSATPVQVRDAYRRRARAVHPDSGGGDAATMIELNVAYETLKARAGAGWEFAGAPATDDACEPNDPAVDEGVDPNRGGWSLLRFFGITLAVVSVAMTTIVFIAAVGYDWSLSP